MSKTSHQWPERVQLAYKKTLFSHPLLREYSELCFSCSEPVEYIIASAADAKIKQLMNENERLKSLLAETVCKNETELNCLMSTCSCARAMRIEEGADDA
jgi:hypothetical protein